MKFRILLICFLAAVPVAMFSRADPPVQPIERSEGMLMRSKLKRSQSVLEGLLRKDLKSVAEDAKEMRLISEAAEWPEDGK